MQAIERLGQAHAPRIGIVEEDVGLVVVAGRRLLPVAQRRASHPALDASLPLPVVPHGDAEIVPVAEQEERRELAEGVGERNDPVATLLGRKGQRAERLLWAP